MSHHATNGGGNSPYLIPIPKTHFTPPEFSFGDLLQHPPSGVWGMVIGMNYVPPDINPHGSGWYYEIRLHPKSCTKMHFKLMDGCDTFREEELQLK